MRSRLFSAVYVAAPLVSLALVIVIQSAKRWPS